MVGHPGPRDPPASPCPTHNPLILQTQISYFQRPVKTSRVMVPLPAVIRSTVKTAGRATTWAHQALGSLPLSRSACGRCRVTSFGSADD